MTDLLCPSCSAANPAGSQFCEACGADLLAGSRGAAASADIAPTAAAVPGRLAPPSWQTGLPSQHATGDGTGPGPSGPAPVSTGNVDPATLPTPQRAATPAPPVAGEESPLDIGWTGVVPGGANPYDAAPAAVPCAACGAGVYADGYCDNCGSKEPNPRDHLEESPANWVAGVSDIGRRHSRNEDALALTAEAEPGGRAVLVVCDGVSNTTDSDQASLAAARAARAVLDQPLAIGAGTPEATAAAAVKRLGDAVAAASKAVVAVTGPEDPAPPSCTFTGAIVAGGTAYVGNVGDSRIYWLPDAGAGARQLSRDDSVAADRIAAGVERKEAETGPMAHSITRWLGTDQPDDVTPHTQAVALGEPGWLLLCSDGLWNYCSEASDLRALVTSTLAAGTAPEPLALARSLVDFANNAGGVDNITVALARIGPPPAPIRVATAETASAPSPAAEASGAPVPAHPGLTDPGPADPGLADLGPADAGRADPGSADPGTGAAPPPAAATDPATPITPDRPPTPAAADLAGSTQDKGGTRGDIHG